MASMGTSITAQLVFDPATGVMRVLANDAFTTLPVSFNTGLGYSNGAGGAVTQASSITTGVTLNTIAGKITTVASTLGALASTAFVVTNSQVAATDVVVLSTTYAGAGAPVLQAITVAAGAFTLQISNGHASAALNAALVINFAIIKGAAA